MYYWNTPALVAELRGDSVSEADFKGYYLFSSVLAMLSVYLVALDTRENLQAWGLEAVVATLIMILGVNAAYAANGGAGGSRFVEKAVAISFPLLLKTLAAGALVGFISVFWLGERQGEWIQTITSLIIQAVFVWRLIVHVRATNA